MIQTSIVILGEEKTLHYLCRQIFKSDNSDLLQFSTIYRSPKLITLRLGTQLFRAITVNPKITAVQLYVEVAPQLSNKSIYRYLKKSGIQKWYCKKRVFLENEKGDVTPLIGICR